MKSLLCVTVVFLLGAQAFAQIDDILAPVPDDAGVPKQEATAQALPKQQAPPPVAEAPAPTQMLTAGDLLERLEKQIADHYSTKGDLKLDFARPWQPVKIPGGDYDVTVSDYPGEGLGAAFLIRCKVISGGQPVGEWQLGLRAQLWQEVWGTTNPLDRGQALDRSLLAVQKVDVLRDKQPYLEADADPALYDAAQGIPAGRPIIKNNVMAHPLIRKGQLVEAVMQNGVLKIRMKALALEDGSANDVIKMRNIESHNEFNAKIINENQVQVQF